MAKSALTPDYAHEEAAKTTAAIRRATSASIAGGMIAAAGRPHSIAEALQLLADVHFSLWPKPGNTRYDEWKQSFDPEKVHK